MPNLLPAPLKAFLLNAPTVPPTQPDTPLPAPAAVPTRQKVPMFSEFDDVFPLKVPEPTKTEPYSSAFADLFPPKGSQPAEPSPPPTRKEPKVSAFAELFPPKGSQRAEPSPPPVQDTFSSLSQVITGLHMGRIVNVNVVLYCHRPGQTIAATKTAMALAAEREAAAAKKAASERFAVERLKRELFRVQEKLKAQQQGQHDAEVSTTRLC